MRSLRRHGTITGVGIPSGAAAAIDRFLHALDDRVPGLDVALYVVGSIALADYHADRSDIDVVVGCSAAPDAGQRSLLAEIHRVIATRIDGPYIPVDALAQRPEEIGPVAFHVDGRFHVGACHEISPVTWATLAEDGITVRGPEPAELGVVADHDAVRAFSADNLSGYWANWSNTIGALIEHTPDDDRIEARMVEWSVLGVARVHCAATTGRVVSKRAGGEYALVTFDDEWHDVIRLAISARDGDVDDVRVGDLRRACAFVTTVARSPSDSDANRANDD